MDSALPQFMPADPQQSALALQDLPDMGLDAIFEDMAPPIKPKYRSWFDPDKAKRNKPSKEFILGSVGTLQTDFIDRNLNIARTLAVIRNEVSGAFPEDVRDRELGKKYGWALTDLRDQYNAAVATLASNTIIYNRKVYDPTQQAKSQIVEDAAYDIRAREERCWFRRGDQDKRTAEAKTLLAYGVLVERRQVDMYEADYPIDTCLIDPAQVYPEWEGKRGLKRVWRIYKDRLANIAYDYLGDEDLSGEIKARMKKEDKDVTLIDTEPLEVVEYWDRWWNAVYLTDGTVIRPPTEHKLGVVPWVITFGPGGESQFTHPQEYYGYVGPTGRIEPYDRRGRSSGYKSTSIINDGIQRNAQNEALVALLVDEMKKASDPPVVLERTSMAAKNPKQVVIDGGKKGVTETLLNEEKLSAFPTEPNPGLIQTIMQFIGKDSQSNGLNLSLLNQVQSNVSGSAVNAAADSGQYQLTLWANSLANHYRACFELDMECWRNVGHYSRFMDETPSPFMIADRQYKTRAVAELTPELLDEVGFEIDVTLHHMKNSEMVPMANAYKLLNDMGIMSKRSVAAVFGVTDYDREAEEWRNERTVDLAFQEPDFLKMVTIPLGLQQQIAALEGNPAAQALLQTMYDEWMEKMAAPMQQQMQAASMGGVPGGQMPQQMANPMGGAPGMAPGMMNPTGAQGVNYQAMAQGPGSVSGVQGGQPAGPPAPPPPPGVM